MDILSGENLLTNWFAKMDNFYWSVRSSSRMGGDGGKEGILLFYTAASIPLSENLKI